MALVTWATYVALTDDTTTGQSQAEEALADAQGLLEEYLGRVGTLESAERTESLRIDGNGKVWPYATPVTDAGDDEITDAGNSITGAGSPISFWLDSNTLAEITYTGGYTADTVPTALKRAIAFGAKELLDTSLSTVPAGATAVSLGDASITFSGPSGSTLQAFGNPLVRRHMARNI